MGEIFPETTVIKVKVKVKVKVKFTLAQAMKAQNGRRGAALLFIRGRDLVPIVQEAGRALGLVWTGAENLAPTGIRSPDRPETTFIRDLKCPVNRCRIMPLSGLQRRIRL